MKIAGMMTAIGSLLLGAVLALFPTHLSVFGTTVSCGAPLLDLGMMSGRTDFTGAMIDQCRSQSTAHVLVSAAVLVIGVFGGMFMYFRAPISMQEITGRPPGFDRPSPGRPARMAMGWAGMGPGPANVDSAPTVRTAHGTTSVAASLAIRSRSYRGNADVKCALTSSSS